MLELSALGLLQREPLHGYRLKQQLELFMSGCISANYGAIYPLLGRLEQRGYIETQSQASGASGRKIYQITDRGRERWREKMLEYPRDSWVNSRSRFAIKFFFFSDLEPELRLKLIEHRLMACRLRHEAVEAQQFPRDRYQKATWQRHLTMLEQEISWLETQLIEEKKVSDRDRNPSALFERRSN